jgi:hypothetical protein
LSRALAIALMRGSLSRYGISANFAHIKADQWLAAHGAELVKGLNETTKTAMQVLLRDAISSGASVDDIASQIMFRFSDMNYARARKIAITETSKAWSYAELESASVMESSGFKMVKEWLLGPNHPRFDICDDNAMAGAIPVNQAFPSGDMATPQHPSCGCSVITYPDPGQQQPWGTNVLGQIPLLPWPRDRDVTDAA